MLALAFTFYIALVSALGQKKVISFEREDGAIDLVSRGKSAQLTVDGNGKCYPFSLFRPVMTCY